MCVIIYFTGEISLTYILMVFLLSNRGPITYTHVWVFFPVMCFVLYFVHFITCHCCFVVASLCLLFFVCCVLFFVFLFLLAAFELLAYHVPCLVACQQGVIGKVFLQGRNCFCLCCIVTLGSCDSCY